MVGVRELGECRLADLAAHGRDSERFWSPQTTTDLPSMYFRMEAESTRLEWLGLTHRSYQLPMIQRMAGASAPAAQVDALLAVAEALEPVKDYNRESTPGEEPTQLKPLNRMVDTVHPESEQSREFSVAVDQFVGAGCKDAVKAATLRAQLAKWAAVDGQVQSLAPNSVLVQNTAPASAALSQAAELALTAFDRIAQGLPLPDSLRKLQSDALTAFETQAHKSQLTIPTIAAFQKLIDASAAGGS